MRYLLGILCMLGCSLNTSGQYFKKGQNPDKNYRQHSKQMTIDLSPIVLSNGRYYYDGRHVTFDQLTMPLLAVRDSAVDRHFRSANRTRLIGTAFQAALGLATSFVWLKSGSAPINSNLFLGLNLGQIVLHQAIKLLMISPQRKAVDRYNEIILQPSAYVLPSYGVGLGLTAKF